MQLDFLGFHAPNNLVLTSAITLDIRAPSMTLSTCQSLCRATSEVSTFAIVEPSGVYYCTPGDATCSLHTRCICGKGKTQKKKIAIFINIRSNKIQEIGSL